MPLKTEDDYARLGEHLTVIDAPLAAFATNAGYRLYPPLQGGRYPNRRLTQDGPVVRSIQIVMDVDGSGNRFDQFFPDIPYVVWGGAWIDDHVAHIRISSPHIETWQIPFSALVRTLQMHLDHFRSYLSSLTEDYIRACGTQSRLSHLPPENA